MKLSAYFACFVFGCSLFTTAVHAQTANHDTTPVPDTAPAFTKIHILPQTPEQRQSSLLQDHPISAQNDSHRYSTSYKGAACAAASDDPDGKKSRLGIGVFIPTGNLASLNANPGFSLIYEYIPKPSRSGDLVFTFGFNYYSYSGSIGGVSASEDVLMFPFLIEYQFHIANHFYLGPAVGYNLVTATASASAGGVSASAIGQSSSFAYGVTAGYQQKSLFAELRYAGSSDSGQAGIIFLLGGRF